VEHRFRVFQNRVLRRIFDSKRDEVIGSWGRPHDMELYNLHASPSIIRIIKSRRIRWEVHVGRIGEKRNACRILVRNPEAAYRQITKQIIML
jgi:hypothetical protein